MDLDVAPLEFGREAGVGRDLSLDFDLVIAPSSFECVSLSLCSSELCVIMQPVGSGLPTEESLSDMFCF